MRLIVFIPSLLATALLLLGESDVSADPLAETLKGLGLVEAAAPTPGSSEAFELDHGPTFVVENQGGLKIHQLDLGSVSNAENLVFDAGAVKYIGVNNGEFGGGLYLDSADGGTEPLFRGNIRGLVPIGQDLYIIEGLAHGLPKGSIYAIRDFASPSPPERITLLPSAPAAFLVDVYQGGERLLIVGYDNFMIFEPDNVLTVIHHETFWGGLYPSSIVEHNGAYIFGMRGGVVVTTAYTVRPNTIRFFRPASPP